MTLLFESISSYKRKLVEYGIRGCEFNYYIRSITANKGLLELDDKEANELLDYLKNCLEIAKNDRLFVVGHIRLAVNEYIQSHQ
jgi:hypothetical protein